MDAKRRTSSSYAEIAAAKGRALVDTFSAHMTPDEVNGWFSKQLGRYPKAGDVYAVAKEFYALQAYRKASLALEMYVTMEGAQIAGEHLLGYAYYRCGRLDRAIEMFRLAVEHGFDADWQLLVEIQCELEAERRALGLIDDGVNVAAGVRALGAAVRAGGAAAGAGAAGDEEEEEVDETEAYIRRVIKGEEGDIVVESFTERGLNRKPKPLVDGASAAIKERAFAEAAAAGGALLRPLLVEEHIANINMDEPGLMRKTVPVAEHVFGQKPSGPPQSMLDAGAVRIACAPAPNTPEEAAAQAAAAVAAVRGLGRPKLPAAGDPTKDMKSID